MERPDGYPGLARAYGLQFAAQPRILDLGLLYRALLDKQVDLVAGNSTDGLLAARDLVILEDDKHYFPPYEAVPIVREDTLGTPSGSARRDRGAGRENLRRADAEDELRGGRRGSRRQRRGARILALEWHRLMRVPESRLHASSVI